MPIKIQNQVYEVFEAAANRIRDARQSVLAPVSGSERTPPVATPAATRSARRIELQELEQVSRFMPKTVSREQYHLENLIVRGADYLYFQIDEDQFRIALTRGSEITSSEFPLRLDIAFDGVPARLFISSWLDTAKGLSPMAPEQFAMLPPQIQQSALMLYFGLFVRRLNQLSGPTVSVLGAATNRAIGTLAPLLNFVIEQRSGAQARFSLHGGRGVLAPVMRLLHRLPVTGNDDVLQLAHVLHLSIGSEQFSVRALAALEQGDVITINSRDFKEYGILRLRVTETQFLLGRLQGDTIVIDEIGSEVNDDAAVGRSVDIENIEVKVTFEIGTKTLSLEALRAMKPGSIVKLDRPTDGLVGVFVNGQRIGVGELVDVDKRMGVRILEMFGRRHG